ncbi:nucleoside triphosphate pyrophosphohydrolase family protein [Psychroserpens algicola]|uniref:Nucleoside triphosphate pyrophosphohydrolase family protein n=1 Tax=Psychroserpens algicola TaxID=1719034 RepID=A0ABT0H3W2_9FLAO|nr:nucleoside triphosphate pyrophosphohydrolase family protein [Psychroserpens algicola]MCK8479068.1 nucleoside triphosphate pyrophosphohydrolase family protein [Psychroserpens algicola]
MDFKTYQYKAEKTIQKYVDHNEIDSIIPFLGIVGETGSVITELKKKIRDGDGYNNYGSQLEEELGDVLWYISTIATQNNLTLEEIAQRNLEKISDRFSDKDLSQFKIYDEGYPKKEQFPREFEINFQEFKDEDGKKKLKIMMADGRQLGDSLTDNAHDEDGYRYHDIFHFGYVAFIGWSPVVRTFLENKRKSEPIIDEVEDGARAQITEELITLYIYSHAQNHQLFKYSNRVDTDVLKAIQKLVSKIEVKDCPTSQWEMAIINSYKVFDELKRNKGGRVLVSIKNRKLIYIGKN